MNLIMRTLSRLMIAAGIRRHDCRGPARRPPWRKAFTFRARVSESISAARHTGSATTTGATPTMIARAFTRKGDITEGHTRTSVAGVTATGISAPRLSVIAEQVRSYPRACFLTKYER